MSLSPKLQVVDNQLAYLVTVTAPDSIKVKYFYDYKTGLKIKQENEVEFSGGEPVEWTDYREINDGVKIPYIEKTSILGEPIEFKVQNAAANTGLPDETFR